MRAPRERHHSTSCAASAGSDSAISGTANSRLRYWNPQSSSSQRLNARSVAISAGTSLRSASSTPTPIVGKSSARVQSLLVEPRDARVAVAVLLADRLDLRHRLAIDAVGNLAAEVQIQAAGDDHRVEGRIRDEAVDAVARDRLDAPARRDEADAAPAQLRIEVAREALLELVVVLVGIEGTRAGGPVLGSRAAIASLGRPRIRSATMFRWICEVPAEIVDWIDQK